MARSTGFSPAAPDHVTSKRPSPCREIALITSQLTTMGRSPDPSPPERTPHARRPFARDLVAMTNAALPPKNHPCFDDDGGSARQPAPRNSWSFSEWPAAIRRGHSSLTDQLGPSSHRSAHPPPRAWRPPLPETPCTIPSSSRSSPIAASSKS